MISSVFTLKNYKQSRVSINDTKTVDLLLKRWNFMDKNYIEIRFALGGTIDQAVHELMSYKQRGELAYGKFNGVFLYSNTITMDLAYKHITGMTKAEYDAKYSF